MKAISKCRALRHRIVCHSEISAETVDPLSSVISDDSAASRSCRPSTHTEPSAFSFIHPTGRRFRTDHNSVCGLRPLLFLLAAGHRTLFLFEDSLYRIRPLCCPPSNATRFLRFQSSQIVYEKTMLQGTLWSCTSYPSQLVCIHSLIGIWNDARQDVGTLRACQTDCAVGHSRRTRTISSGRFRQVAQLLQPPHLYDDEGGS